MKNARISAAALAASLCACSGYHGGALPAAGTATAPQAALRSANTMPALHSEGTGRATLLLALTIHRRRRERPNYISPSTRSVQIKERKTVLGTFNTTPTSKGCLQQNGTTVCRFSMGAIPGKNAPFTISTYDGTGATGNLLSDASLLKTIAASKANTISVSLNGVAASIALALSNTNPTQGAAADLTLTLTALDADGNTIVAPGNYAHPISLADSDTAVATLSMTSIKGPSANVVTVHYTGAVGSATFTASAGGVQNATATLQSVKPHSQYVGGVWAALPGYGSIPYYDNSATPSLGLNGGALSSATAVAVDDVGGVLAGDASGNIEHWPINAVNTATPSESLSGAGNVSALTWDAVNSRIIYAASGTSSFCVVAAGASGALGAGNQTCYSAPTYPIASTVSGLAIDQRTGDLYVANATAVTGVPVSGGYCPQGSGGNVCVSVLVFTPSGTAYNFDHYLDLEAPLSGDTFDLGQITFDPTTVNSDGSTGVLWVTNETPGNDNVRGVSSSSTGANIPAHYDVDGDGANLVTPATVAWDGSGGLWIGDRSTTWLQHWTNVYSSPTTANSYFLGAHDGNVSPSSIAVFNVYVPTVRHRRR
jgi:hypothetical protein